MKYNKKMMIIAMFAVVLSGSLHAKVKAVMTRRDFEQTLSKAPMVIALFYEDEKKGRRSGGENKGLMRMYEDLSGYQLYDDADLIFLKVNVGRKDLADLATLYGVKSMPTFIFFNNGKRLINRQGVPLNLEGFVSRADLQLFIDNHYGVAIEKYVVNKENRRSHIVAEENESWKLYFYPRDMVMQGYAPEEAINNME